MTALVSWDDVAFLVLRAHKGDHNDDFGGAPEGVLLVGVTSRDIAVFCNNPGCSSDWRTGAYILHEDFE